MTPDPSFVKDLTAYDRQLRVRWGPHTARWLIERRLPPRNPQWIAERPNPFGRSPRAKDLWEGWKAGYLHVLSVDRELLHWQTVAPVLAEADAQQAGGWAALNVKMDAAEAAWEASLDRERVTWQQAAGYEAADMLAWLQGRRVSMFQPEAEAIRHPDGFVIRDRRVRA